MTELVYVLLSSRHHNVYIVCSNACVNVRIQSQHNFTQAYKYNEL